MSLSVSVVVRLVTEASPGPLTTLLPSAYRAEAPFAATRARLRTPEPVSGGTAAPPEAPSGAAAAVALLAVLMSRLLGPAQAAILHGDKVLPHQAAWFLGAALDGHVTLTGSRKSPVIERSQGGGTVDELTAASSGPSSHAAGRCIWGGSRPSPTPGS
ncbi:hypothetical protein AB0I28_30240 [Phytomonospora sp. NPDC050363]|uniref:hypothetical protein n=1 Tax=Phytomonospora sp. NPDC050363 TaxID=3155642 RepID=UPI0033C1E105